MNKLIDTKNKLQLSENHKFSPKSITMKDKEKLKLIDTIFEVDVQKIVESVREEVRNEIIQKVNELLIILKNNNKNQTYTNSNKINKSRLKNVTLSLKEIRKKKMINSKHPIAAVNFMGVKTDPQKNNQHNLNQILKRPKLLQNINIRQNKNVFDVLNRTENNNMTSTLNNLKDIQNTKANDNLKLVYNTN